MSVFAAEPSCSTENDIDTEQGNRQAETAQRPSGPVDHQSKKPFSVTKIGRRRNREKPEALQKIDETIRHLNRTLRCHKKAVPPSLREQLCGLLSHWFRQRLKGQTSIHPGISKMAGWADVSERQAQKNLRVLEAWNVVITLAHEHGGKGNATEFSVDIGALERVLILLNVNPSRQLSDKLRDLRDGSALPAICQPDEKGRISPVIQGSKGELSSAPRGEVKGELSSPRIYNIRDCSSSDPSNVSARLPLDTTYDTSPVATLEQLLRKKELVVAEPLQSKPVCQTEPLKAKTAMLHQTAPEPRILPVQARAVAQVFSEWEARDAYHPDSWR